MDDIRRFRARLGTFAAVCAVCVASMVRGGEARAGTVYFGAYDGEPRRPDGHVDTALLAAKLVEGHINFYNYLIWHSSWDWEDLRSFLEATKHADIRVIVDLTPPSEPPCSKPFCYNWRDWSVNIAQLSLSYPSLIGYSIDDFTLNFQQRSKSGVVIREKDPEIVDMVRAGKEVNPRLLFLPTVYGDTLSDFAATYRGVADGPLLYTEYYQGANTMPDETYWKGNISAAQRDFKVVLEGIYAIGRGTPPPAGIPTAKVRLAHDLGATGIVMYLLPWSGPTWDAVTGLYGQWNRGGPALSPRFSR